MNQGIMALQNAGRGEDTRLAHLMQGEVIVPPHIIAKNKSLKKALERHLARTGTNLSDITVGSNSTSINPYTGLEEFGFLSRLWKKVKKVIDPVSKVAQFIPGPWQAPSVLYQKGKSAVKVIKGEGGLGDLVNIFTGPKFGDALGNVGKSFTDIREFFTKGSDGIGFFENLQNIGGNIKEYVTKGEDGVGFFGNLRDSASKFFTPQQYVGPNPEGEGTITYTKAQYDALPPEQQAQFSAMPSKASDLFQNIQGGIGDLPETYGNFVEKTGVNPALLALAKYYGDATERALEKESGGMGDIRQSLRPDLAVKTYGGLGGFNLGYAEGGEVMDMRAGGESVGPGTGTSDDIPAMLSDGEFVMTAKANLGAGSVGLKKGKGGIMELVPQGEPDRQRGADNMMKLMRYFEARA